MSEAKQLMLDDELDPTQEMDTVQQDLEPAQVEPEPEVDPVTVNLIEQLHRHNAWLKENKKTITSDNSLFLYRLPLTEQQREAVYNEIMKLQKNKTD